MGKYDSLKGDFPIYEFSSFIPDSKNPFPYNRVMNYITVGPFVLKTKGSFEAEHFYERDKILLEDYLASDGGEKNIAPVLGQAVTNKYYGDEYLYWKKGFIKWDTLRFDDKDDSACDPALFATEQRNAVYYAAFYIHCQKDEKAVICYDNSGSTLFVNGELCDFKPYGRVKGVWTLGYQIPVEFKKGNNLILFKLRPGYIADTMDLSMTNCSIFPIEVYDKGLGITTPTKTNAYTGSLGHEKQVFPCFAAAFENTENSILSYCDQKIAIPKMEKGSVFTFRFSIPSGKEDKISKEKVQLGSQKGSFYFPTTPYDGYEGVEHVVSDFHFDTTYHQEQRTYALGAMHITKCIVENLIKNPDFKATLSELDYLHPFYSIYPQYRDVITQSFKEGRSESDCFYNQPNDLTSSGEAFIRNLIYGQLYHRDVMGRISTVYGPEDVFGHFSQITQVCKKGGCDYIKWGKSMMGVDSLFHHISPDGSTLLHDKGNGRSSAMRLGIKGCGASSGALSYMESVPRNGDTSWMKETVSNIKFSVYSDLAKDVNRSAKETEENFAVSPIDYTSRDLTQHHSGVLLTRTDFKQANRLCENLLITAEKFSAIAFLYGAKYPDKAIDKATRQILCAQHHDSITGTNNEISFIDLMIEYKEAADLLIDIVNKACNFIASSIKTKDNKAQYIYVFNPLTWERNGKCYFNLPKSFPKNKGAVLEDIKGKKYSCVIEGNKGYFLAEKLSPMGYNIFKISPCEKQELILSNEEAIENSKFKLVVDKNKGGAIISIFDKKNKKELVKKDAQTPANTVYVLKEIHDRMETQHEFYTTGHKLVSSDYIAEIKKEKTELYQKLIIKTKLDMVANLIQEITLFKNADTIDFKTTVEDYQSVDDLFTVAFPLDIKGAGVVFDDRGTPHVSIRSKKFMSFQTHQYASFSGCRVLPAGNFFGLTPTVKFNINGKGSINLGMTALIRKIQKATVDPSTKLTFALSKKAIPVTPYPDREQHGGDKIIHFNEDVYETDTRIVLSIEGDGNLYKEKLLKNLTSQKRQKITAEIEKTGYAVIYSKDSDNIYKKAIDVVLVVAKNSIELMNFVNNISEILEKGWEINLKNVITLSPIEQSENYGCVLLNNGTGASSVEGESTLNMMLFHTAAFYGNMGKVTGDKELVPENKSHVFTYSLYPFKNSYREANVYKKAYEFDNPAFSFTDIKPRKDAYLEENKSFLKSPDGFMITAFKGAKYPYANLKNVSESPQERGFTIRGNEIDGASKTVKLDLGFNVENAQRTNLLDEPTGEKISVRDNKLSFKCPSHSIETLLFKPQAVKKTGSGTIGAETESVNKIYVRSWEHDMGSVAMGNLGFCATIEKLPRNENVKNHTLYINAVNNLDFKELSQEIKIEASKGITLDKANIKTTLKPGGYDKIPLNVTLDSPETQGQVTISYTYDGMEFYDVYEFGYFNPKVSLKILDDKIVCNVENPTDQKLLGGLYLAVPFELWGDVLKDDKSLISIVPHSFMVELKPFENKEYIFEYTKNNDVIPAFWAACKLCVNGRIHFGYDQVKGPRHNIWAHEFCSEISKDNGSIKKILEM